MATVSLRYFILGLLSQKPMSGYDIKYFLKHFNWLIGTPSFGSLYPALHALLEDKLATVELCPCEGKPQRKIYSITDAGRQVLRDWIQQPVESDVPLKAFMMRLILADGFESAELIAYLQRRQAQVLAQQATLEQVMQALDGKAGLGQDLAFDCGLALAVAELAWLDSTLERLS
ncbi:MAG: hypothetical protein B6I34_07385 [Anaerolineaceae bacterium 4572_32.1]|nr:MAG: hypothetical protein B6I34_07385 [Anaerolineaceae bacterium 4572_32.1]